MSLQVLIALGSNLGDRAGYLDAARAELARLPTTAIASATKVRETAPIGPSTDPFLNQMVLVRTELAPNPLLRHLQQIERQHERVRTERWGARTLDLDIVWIDGMTLDEPDLVVPHPEIGNRPFWIEEMSDLLPETWSAPEVGWPDWAQVSESRYRHIRNVAGLLGTWALIQQVSTNERARWIRAAYLHDALKDAPVEHLRRLAEDQWGHSPLFHGPAAANEAERLGEMDREVLEAVRYHTTGYAEWGATGRMLYMADALEPGRARRPPDAGRLITLVPHDPDRALAEIASYRRDLLIRSGYDIPAETEAFWHTLSIHAA